MAARRNRKKRTVEKKSRVILCVSAGVDVENVRQVLASTPDGAQGSPVEILCDERSLEPSPRDALFVIGYCKPQLAIAQLIKQGKDIVDATASWADSAERICSFYELNRKNALVVDMDDALRNAGSFVETLSRRITAKIAPAADFSPAYQLDPVSEIIGAYATVTEGRIDKALNRLKRITTVIGAAESQMSLEAVRAVLSYRDELEMAHQMADGLKKRSDEVEAENKAVIEAMHSLQEELERLRNDIEFEKEKYRSLKKFHSEKKAELAETKRKLRKAERRLESMFKEKEERRRSFYWRFTQPFRWLASALR